MNNESKALELAQAMPQWAHTAPSIRELFERQQAEIESLRAQLDDAATELRAEQERRRAEIRAQLSARVPDVDDLRDRLVAISSFVADSNHKASQAMIGDTLAMLSAGRAPDELEFDASECSECCGKGWNWEDHQVAERKSDIQTFKIDCPACWGVGFVGPDAERRAAMLSAAPSQQAPSNLAALVKIADDQAKYGVAPHRTGFVVPTHFDPLTGAGIPDPTTFGQASQQAPNCATCNDNGLIGGPSYYAPDEGGDPCPECSQHEQPAPREHITSPDCWCNPELNYVDPETGGAVYVHKEPQ